MKNCYTSAKRVSIAVFLFYAYIIRKKDTNEEQYYEEIKN